MIDLRLRELEGISKSLKYYKDSYGSLDEWVRDMEAAQLKAQETKPEDSKALAELLNQQKVGPEEAPTVMLWIQYLVYVSAERLGVQTPGYL